MGTGTSRIRLFFENTYDKNTQRINKGRGNCRVHFETTAY
ncbi:unnamed protein product [Haemonchus placei]|uniref:Uncharacterized protein n=1 Tax=Haemonchus placei TaxID=6290 RepID=A0A3P7WR15_HAEPC|nr:unnamed protein product [Haemonchus placei]